MMCSLKGCKEKAGMCGHEKMMAGMLLAVVVALAAGKIFGVF